jgi:hypothetical protein
LEPIFSFENLIPDFVEVYRIGDYSSSDGFSTLIISLIILVAAVFSIYALITYFLSTKQVSFYKRLLLSVDQSELPKVHADLTENAFRVPAYGLLWKEFDESLVHTQGKISNTIDAEHFFNTRSLANGLTENRLLAAVPGFLTAIGVIGTFAGLQMGLAPMTDLDPNGADNQKLLTGIYSMIGGASIAFTTSVWGISLSVLFNAFEKFLERSARTRILQLQNRIDYLYPRIIPEESLVRIADHSQSSKETLDGLAEKIGDRMQEIMTTTAQTISESMVTSIEASLKPAMDRFSEVISEGPGDVLEGIIEVHSDRLRQSGDQQRALMDEANERIAETVSGMGDKFDEFLSGIEKSAAEASEKEDLRNETLKKKISEFATIGERETVRVSRLVNTLLTNHNQLDDARQTAFAAMTGELQEQQTGMIEKLHEVASSLVSLQEGFSQLVQSNTSAVTRMQDVSNKMGDTATAIEKGGAEIKLAASTLGESVSKAVEETIGLSESSQLAAQAIVSSTERFENIQSHISTLSNDLQGATKHAETAFQAMDQHMQSYKEGLKKHINELEMEMEKVLSRYAALVQEGTENRLSVWNEETNKYISSMTDAVRAIQGVVEEIETRTRSSS